MARIISAAADVRGIARRQDAAARAQAGVPEADVEDFSDVETTAQLIARDDNDEAAASAEADDEGTEGEDEEEEEEKIPLVRQPKKRVAREVDVPFMEEREHWQKRIREPKECRGLMGPLHGDMSGWVRTVRLFFPAPEKYEAPELRALYFKSYEGELLCSSILPPVGNNEALVARFGDYPHCSQPSRSMAAFEGMFEYAFDLPEGYK